MQDGFVPNNPIFWYYTFRRKQLINNIIDRIEKAKERSENIVLVECVGDGDTLPEIQQSLGGYDKKTTLYKTGNGLLDCPDNYRMNGIVTEGLLTGTSITCVGVNRSCCVAETVLGIESLSHKVGSQCSLLIPRDSTLNIPGDLSLLQVFSSNTKEFHTRSLTRQLFG